jgi:hypothetical protein
VIFSVEKKYIVNTCSAGRPNNVNVKINEDLEPRTAEKGDSTEGRSEEAYD